MGFTFVYPSLLSKGHEEMMDTKNLEHVSKEFGNTWEPRKFDTQRTIFYPLNSVLFSFQFNHNFTIFMVFVLSTDCLNWQKCQNEGMLDLDMPNEQLLKNLILCEPLANVSLFPPRKCTRGGVYDEKICPQCVIKYFSHDASIKILNYSSHHSRVAFESSSILS